MRGICRIHRVAAPASCDRHHGFSSSQRAPAPTAQYYRTRAAVLCRAYLHLRGHRLLRRGDRVGRCLVRPERAQLRVGRVARRAALAWCLERHRKRSWDYRWTFFKVMVCTSRSRLGLWRRANGVYEQPDHARAGSAPRQAYCRDLSRRQSLPFLRTLTSPNAFTGVRIIRTRNGRVARRPRVLHRVSLVSPYLHPNPS